MFSDEEEIPAEDCWMGTLSADAQNSLLVSVLVERPAGESKLYKIKKMHEIKIKLKNMPNSYG